MIKVQSVKLGAVCLQDRHEGLGFNGPTSWEIPCHKTHWEYEGYVITNL